MISNVLNKSTSLRIFYRVMIVFVFAAMNLYGPGMVDATSARKPVNDLVIVTGAPLIVHVPDPRLNTMWQDLASGYAEALRAQIARTGKKVQLRVIPDRKTDIKNYLEQLLATNKYDAVVQVVVDVTIKEQTYYLISRFNLIEYQRTTGGGDMATLLEGMTMKYPMLSASGNDMSNVGIPELADRFVRELQKQGYL